MTIASGSRSGRIEKDERKSTLDGKEHQVMSIKAKIEALLYVTDKPVKAPAVAKMLGEDVQSVRQAILELIHDYETRSGALEIADEDGYILQVKDEYASVIEEFSPIEMPLGVIRTLSAIAIKQPISQSEIIRIRGASAYDHIKDLVSRQLVSKREEGGRSPVLSTTKRFQEYFKLSKDGKSLRQYLRRQAKKLEQQDTGDGQNNEPLVQQLPLNYDLLRADDITDGAGNALWETVVENADAVVLPESINQGVSTNQDMEQLPGSEQPEQVAQGPDMEQDAEQLPDLEPSLSADAGIGLDVGLSETTSVSL